MPTEKETKESLSQSTEKDGEEASLEAGKEKEGRKTLYNNANRCLTQTSSKSRN